MVDWSINPHHKEVKQWGLRIHSTNTHFPLDFCNILCYTFPN